MASAESLSPGEGVPAHRFTDPARTLEDLAALVRIQRSLVTRVHSGLGGGVWTQGGESHWLVVTEMGALIESRPVTGVGFFGQARADVDHSPIVELEHELLSRAEHFPGLLAYYDVRFVNGQWGNLVLFTGEDDVTNVKSDPVHREALALAADHYCSVRLHRLSFPNGALARVAPALESTLLIDFTETPPWRAIRRGPC